MSTPNISYEAYKEYASCLSIIDPAPSPHANNCNWGSRTVEQSSPNRETYMKWANVAAHVGVIFAQVLTYLALLTPLLIGISIAPHLSPLLICLAASTSGTSTIMVNGLTKYIFDDLHEAIDRNIK